MSRDPSLRLHDILESIIWIESYIQGHDLETFFARFLMHQCVLQISSPAFK